MKNTNFIQHLKSDIPASIVVFFVAIPPVWGLHLPVVHPYFRGLLQG